MSDKPLVIDAPDEAEPPTVPETENVPSTPPAEFTPGPTEAQAPAKKPREKKARTEFDIMSDIREAFEALPSDAARRRVWDYLTSWLGEKCRQVTMQTLACGLGYSGIGESEILSSLYRPEKSDAPR